MPQRRLVMAVILALAAWARMASAQTSPPTVEYYQFFGTLYAPATQAIAANGGPAMTSINYAGATVLAGLLTDQIVNLPTASNAGGFSWSYDPALGTWSRSVDSFGPQTVERSQTVGRRKLNFGFAYQRFTFDQLNGDAMSVQSQGSFSGLDLTERVTLSRADVTLNTTYLNYGITSHLDIGVFLPVVTVVLDGSLDYTLNRASGALLSQGTNTASSRTQRLGDVVIRGKWNFVHQPWGGVAVAFDGRVHSQNQPGAGALKLQFIASRSARAVNMNANVGLSYHDCRDEPVRLCNHSEGAFMSGGVDRAVTNRLTLAADIQARWFEIHQEFNETRTRPSDAVSYFTEKTGTAILSMTAKFNAWGNALVTFTGLVPLSNSGLVDHFTPIVGIDYSW